MALFVRAVGRAHQWTREDRTEPHRLALLAKPAKFVWMHPAVDDRVLRRRLEVLADGHDVDAVRPKIAERLDDFVVCFPKTDDDPGLRQDRVVSDLLRPFEQPERLVVRDLGAPHAAMKAAH